MTPGLKAEKPMMYRARLLTPYPTTVVRWPITRSLLEKLDDVANRC